MAFLLIFIFVSATLLGAISGHYYVLPLVSFVVIPAMDTILGATRVAPPRWSLWIYYLPLQLYAVFHIFLIFWGCWWISTHELTLTEQVGLICSIGLVTGAVGINVSHEFIHRKSRLNRFLGEVMLVSVCYGHFAIEHIWGHHKNMATPMDPVSARKGETLYQFLPRAIIGSLACAYRIRPRRTQVYLASSFALALLLFWTFGPEALVLFLGQSWIAFSLLEITNYIEHYGLTRRTNWTNLIFMKTVNVHEAKTNFSSLLARVEASKERIVICRNGEPIADLVPHQRKDRTSAHATLRRITIGYNPVETLSDDEWPQSSR